MEREDIQFLEPQAWLPAPMLGGKPLMDDASIRDFNGGIGYHVIRDSPAPQGYGGVARL